MGRLQPPTLARVAIAMRIRFRFIGGSLYWMVIWKETLLEHDMASVTKDDIIWLCGALELMYSCHIACSLHINSIWQQSMYRLCHGKNLVLMEVAYRYLLSHIVNGGVFAHWMYIMSLCPATRRYINYIIRMRAFMNSCKRLLQGPRVTCS